MAGAVLFGKSPPPGIGPNNFTESFVIPNATLQLPLRLMDGLAVEDIEFNINNDRVQYRLIDLSKKYTTTDDLLFNNGRMVIIEIYDTGKGNDKFVNGSNITAKVRNISTGEVYCNITWKYNGIDNVGDFQNIKVWATNALHGNGYTTITSIDNPIILTRLVHTYTLPVKYVLDNSKLTALPYQNKTIQAYSADDSFMQHLRVFGTTNIAVESGKHVATANIGGIFPTNTGLTSFYTEMGSDVEYSSFTRQETHPIVIRTFNLAENNIGSSRKTNIAWDKGFIVNFATKYKGLNPSITTYPEVDKNVDKITMFVDLEQDNLFKVFPYINSDEQFCCAVLPILRVNKLGLVYFHAHNNQAWDNGNYETIVLEFNVTNGSTKTPILTDKTEYRVKQGDNTPFKVFHTANNINNYKVVIGDSNICSVDKNSNSIVGLKGGSTTITFSATREDGGWTEGSVTVKVIVDPIPTTPELSVDRSIVKLQAGEATTLDVRAVRADKLKFVIEPDSGLNIIDHTKEDYGVSDGFNTNYNPATITGKLELRGVTPGVYFITIYSTYKGVDQLAEMVEVEVLERKQHLIYSDVKKLKVDLKKHKVTGKPLWVTTSTKHLKWKMPANPIFSVVGNTGLTDINVTIMPLAKGRQILVLQGYDDDPNTILATLEIEIQITKNVEVPKDQAWVAVEYKQKNQTDVDPDDTDPRHFAVLKWLDRPTKDDIYNHKVIIPNRSGTLLTIEELEEAKNYQKRYFEYAKQYAPSRTINPNKIGVIWLDTSTGKIWKCLDIEKDNNSWLANTGEQIAPQSKMIYPKPGEKGFGAGPMSYDLHESYGLTPMDGCFDSNSDNYGNYKDENGNVFVYVPKHYVKITGSKY